MLFMATEDGNINIIHNLVGVYRLDVLPHCTEYSRVGNGRFSRTGVPLEKHPDCYDGGFLHR